MSEDQNAKETLATLATLFRKHENELKAEGVTWTEALLVQRIINDATFKNNTAGVRDFCTDRGGLEKIMNYAPEPIRKPACTEIVPKSASRPLLYWRDPSVAHVPEAGFWPTFMLAD